MSWSGASVRASRWCVRVGGVCGGWSGCGWGGGGGPAAPPLPTSPLPSKLKTMSIMMNIYYKSALSFFAHLLIFCSFGNEGAYIYNLYVEMYVQFSKPLFSGLLGCKGGLRCEAGEFDQSVSVVSVL